MQPTPFSYGDEEDYSLRNSPALNQAEEALRQFAADNDGELLNVIRPIVLANVKRGRVARCLGQGHYASVDDYISGVAHHYQMWQRTVDALVTQRHDDAWLNLLSQLERAARRYLSATAFHLRDGLESSAATAAVDAAIEILRGRFPYDCDFPAWAYAIVRVRCRHMLTEHCQAADMLYHCGDTGGDSDDVAADVAALPDDVLLDLELATNRLATPMRREFVRLHYYEGKSYVELAGEMGKSMGALYKLNSDTLANYRQLLSQ